MVFVGRGFSRDILGPANKGFSPGRTTSFHESPCMRWLHLKCEIHIQVPESQQAMDFFQFQK